MATTPITLPSPPRLIAHSPNEQNQWHSFDDHILGVTRLAMGFAAVFGEQSAAEVLGMWHDAGKIAPEWQAALYAAALAAAQGNKKQRVGVPHTDVGMVALLEAGAHLWPLALLSHSHHGGLYDRDDLSGKHTAALNEPRVQRALPLARAELAGRCDPGQWAPRREVWGAKLPGHIALRLRMIHSCLVDADCLDTAAHEDPLVLADPEHLSLEELRVKLEASTQALAQDAPDTAVNRCRALIASDCVRAAPMAPGFFSLTVPTGGGKTLCGMSFALTHAVCHGQRRVIVAIPYTSIIEQNADVYRKVFGRDAVLEHHSAADEPAGLDDDAARRYRLAALRWDAPVVVTTHVQLFESLFAARNSKLRKLHQIAHSVIILDEVQTLPPKLLAPTLQALTVLVKQFNCTVVFSTATQPAFAPGVVADKRCQLDDLREIIAEPQAHFEALKRVEYTFEDARMSWAEVAERVGQERQALVICNTVKDAQALVAELDEAPGLLHISTRLCGAHRSEVLAAVKAALSAKAPCLLVSTQVVEAGVDLDFPCVWRAMGPLDGIIQAAGRCNREGKIPNAGGRVVVFEPDDGGCPPGAYSAGRQVTRIMLEGRLTPTAMHAPATCTEYFKRLYSDLNADKGEVCELEAKCRFEESAKAYKIIEDDMTPVVIERDDAPQEERALIAAVLLRVRRFGVQSRDLRDLQPYMVSLRRRDMEASQRAGLVEEVVRYNGQPQPLHLWRGRYDARLGLMLGADQLDPGSLIIA